MVDPTVRSQVFKRHKSLVRERGAFDSHWKAIAKNLLPRSSRFTSTERNRMGARNDAIIDSTATQHHRTLAAGMMAGMTSPARPWFRLTTPDEDRANTEAARKWLNDVQTMMLRVFAKSNTYNSLHSIYKELGAFGTGASVIVPHPTNLIHQYTQTVGEYAFGLDEYGFVSVFDREFDINVEQLVAWFGYQNCSMSAKRSYDCGDYDRSVTVIHLIEPRHDRDTRLRDQKNMPWRDIYMEKGGDGDQSPNKGLLQEGGYRQFPTLGPRWDVLWNDSYGSGPGMDALGDLMQLQHQQYRKAKAIDYQTDPPLQLPTSLRGNEADLLPGGVTYFDSMAPGSGIRTAFEVNLDLGALREDIVDVRERLRSCFYADLFLMLSSADVKGMTATEVAERHEEKLLVLGPVLERLQSEMLSPLIETTFARMLETGMLPPPPEELSNQDLDVEYVSMLAQAQKAVQVNSIDRLIGHIGVLANIRPEVVDTYDPDLSVERYADALGVDPDLIVTGESLTMIRDARDRQQQAAVAAQAAAQTAQSVSQLGSVATDGGASNAGADLINMFSGYNSPSGVEV